MMQNRALWRLFGWSLYVWIAAANVAIACTCTWGGPFLAVVSERNLVVRARVVQYDNELRPGVFHSMWLEVLDVIMGQEDRSRIRVWGDNGLLCRPYVTRFPVNTEWVFALDRQGASDYSISVCGEYWASIDGDEVVGKLELTEDVHALRERLPYSEVVRKLKERFGGAERPVTEIEQ